MNVTVKRVPTPNDRMAQLIGSLGPAGRKELNDGASAQLWADVRAHLRSYAHGHHATASRLGASPTGHLEKAAATMQHWSDADSATVAINSPGIRRALGPLTIRPSRARALTIPIHALAYGKRVGELGRSHAIFRIPKTDVLAAEIGGALTALYVLRASVTLPQERGLLPSQAAMERSVKTGYLARIRSILQKARSA